MYMKLIFKCIQYVGSMDRYLLNASVFGMFPLFKCKFLTTVGVAVAFAIRFVAFAFSVGFAEIATKPINELFNLKLKEKKKTKIKE